MFVTLTEAQLSIAYTNALTEWEHRCDQADACQAAQNAALDAYQAAVRAGDKPLAAAARDLVTEHRAAARSAYAAAIEQGDMVAAITRAIRNRQDPDA
jgi:hypothetical protein